MDRPASTFAATRRVSPRTSALTRSALATIMAPESSYAAQFDALKGCKDVDRLNSAHPKPSKVRVAPSLAPRAPKKKRPEMRAR